MTTAPAASSSLSLVRARSIEPHDAEDDQPERGDLEEVHGLAVGGDADQRDRGRADGRPDRVGGTDAEVLEYQREQEERDAVAGDDDRRGYWSGEPVGRFESNRGDDFGGDGKGEVNGGHALTVPSGRSRNAVSASSLASSGVGRRYLTAPSMKSIIACVGAPGVNTS